MEIKMKISLVFLSCLLSGIVQFKEVNAYEWCVAPNREHPTGVQVSLAPAGCSGYCRSYWKKDGGACIKGKEYRTDGRTLRCVCSHNDYVKPSKSTTREPRTTKSIYGVFGFGDNKQTTRKFKDWSSITREPLTTKSIYGAFGFGDHKRTTKKFKDWS